MTSLNTRFTTIEAKADHLFEHPDVSGVEVVGPNGRASRFTGDQRLDEIFVHVLALFKLADQVPALDTTEGRRVAVGEVTITVVLLQDTYVMVAFKTGSSVVKSLPRAIRRLFKA